MSEKEKLMEMILAMLRRAGEKELRATYFFLQGMLR